MNIEAVKKNLNRSVIYKDIKDVYILTACIIRKNDNGFFYQAEIKDKNANSLIFCKLEDITEEQQ